jgi:hypothetical protein
MRGDGEAPAHKPGGGPMRESFFKTLQDETLRTELGAAVVESLAVENIELSTPATSRAVRRTVIERRA